VKLAVYVANQPDRTGWSFFDRSVILVTIMIAVLLVGTAVFGRTWVIDDSGTGSSLSAGPVTAALVANPSATNPGNLRLVVRGLPQIYANGSEMTISGNLRGRIAVGAFSDTPNHRSMDIFVYTGDGNSRPVLNLAVQATAHMPGMTEGSFQQVARAVGDGHYLLPLQFAMAGPWQIDLSFSEPGQSPNTLQLDLNVDQ
jgi:hypothetical protein